MKHPRSQVFHNQIGYKVTPDYERALTRYTPPSGLHFRRPQTTPEEVPQAC